MKLDPEKLDEVIQQAGLGKRSADKVRKANGAEPTTARGHGAPAPTVRKRGGL